MKNPKTRGGGRWTTMGSNEMSITYQQNGFQKIRFPSPLTPSILVILLKKFNLTIIYLQGNGDWHADDGDFLIILKNYGCDECLSLVRIVANIISCIIAIVELMILSHIPR